MYICIYIYMYIYQDYGAQVAAWIKHLLVQASTVKFYGLGFGVQGLGRETLTRLAGKVQT